MVHGRFEIKPEFLYKKMYVIEKRKKFSSQNFLKVHVTIRASPIDTSKVPHRHLMARYSISHHSN